MTEPSPSDYNNLGRLHPRKVYLHSSSTTKWQCQDDQRCDAGGPVSEDGPLTTNEGSLTDKSVRIRMENPIFKKLQDIIEYPCKSKEWFVWMSHR